MSRIEWIEMQVSELTEHLSALAKTWERQGESQAVRALLAFISSLPTDSRMTVANLANALSSLDVRRAGLFDDTATVFIKHLGAELIFIDSVSTNATRAAFNTLFTGISRFEGMNFQDLIQKLRQSLVSGDTSESVPEPADTAPPAPANDHPLPDTMTQSEYVDALEAAIGDETAFLRVFEKLKSDPDMKRPNVVAIASKVAFHMAKSTTKKLALKRIWDMHEAALTMDAKMRAVGG